MTSRDQDVVFTFSFETWSDAVQREMMRPPDRLLVNLMDSPEVRRLLVVNPFRSYASVAFRRLGRIDKPFPRSPSQKLLTPVRLKRHDSHDVDTTRTDMRTYGRSLRSAAERLGMHEPLVVSTNPVVAGFAPFDWAGSLTYYGRDDWLSSESRRLSWPVFESAYRSIARSGAAVVAVSQQIIDRIEPTGPHHVVPNGVEPAEWLGPVTDAPAWFEKVPGPRAVYVGTLDSRIDTEGLVALATARPDLSIVLVGPVRDSGHVAPLRGIDNVHLHSRVGRADLVAILRHADVCLVSHRRTRLTEAMSPLKIFEYLAAGAPVISVDLPPVHDLGPRVLLVDTVAEFSDVVDDALAMGRADETDRISFVQSNSWAARHRVIRSVMSREVG